MIAFSGLLVSDVVACLISRAFGVNIFLSVFGMKPVLLELWSGGILSIAVSLCRRFSHDKVWVEMI